MDCQLIVITTIFCFLTHHFMPGSTGESTALDDLIQNSKRRPQFNLSCFVCHSETHKGCLKLDDNVDESHIYAQPCGPTEMHCMVKRISFTTSTGSGPNNTLPMKTVAIKRNCTQKCEPGCVIMGERTRLYVCSTCCTSHLCNVGSGAWRSLPNSFVTFLFLLLRIPYSVYNLLVSILYRTVS